MAKAIKWQECYSVGHPGVDPQHKQLLELINNLYEAKEQQREHAFRKDGAGAAHPVRDDALQVRGRTDEGSELSAPRRASGLACSLATRTVGLRTHLKRVMASDVLCSSRTGAYPYPEEDKA